MIFARTADDNLAGLVKQLDELVAENKDKKMATLVNFIGDDVEALKKTAIDFGKKHGIENSALVVPTKDYEAGPKKYGIPKEAAVAVMLYRGKKVQHTHTFGSGPDKSQVAAVVADTKKLLDAPAKDKKKKKKDRKKKAA